MTVLVENFVFIVSVYSVVFNIDEVHSSLHSIILIESFSSSVLIVVFVVTSTFHSTTSTSVQFVSLLTAKIVHLTAATLSDVCI